MTESDVARFEAKVHFRPGCWPWLGAISNTGYGNFAMWPHTVAAHRFSYELYVGPIPDGLDIDHLCRNRACVRPSHMEPVTRKVNTLRGTGPTAVNAVKTHCLRGHELTVENTYWQGDKRSCLACRRFLWQRWSSVNSRGHRRRTQNTEGEHAQ